MFVCVFRCIQWIHAYSRPLSKHFVQMKPSRAKKADSPSVPYQPQSILIMLDIFHMDGTLTAGQGRKLSSPSLSLTWWFERFLMFDRRNCYVMTTTTTPNSVATTFFKGCFSVCTDSLFVICLWQSEHLPARVAHAAPPAVTCKKKSCAVKWSTCFTAHVCQRCPAQEIWLGSPISSATLRHSGTKTQICLQYNGSLTKTRCADGTELSQASSQNILEFDAAAILALTQETVQTRNIQ